MQYNLAPATLRQLQIFFYMAETLSFNQVNQELSISQDAVVKELKKLESILAFPLFEWHTPYFRLTPKGAICYQSWLNIISTIEQGANRALYHQTEDANILRVGVAFYINYNGIHRKIIDLFQAKYPHITLISTESGIPELEALLAQHDLDVIFIPDTQIYGLNRQAYSWKYLTKKPLSLLVTPHNPLAQCATVRMSDILHTPIITLDPTIDSSTLSFLKNLYQPYGRTPAIVGYYQSTYEITSLLEETNGLCIVGDYFPDAPVKNCKRIPITDQYGGLVAIWNKFNGKACVENFVNLKLEDETLSQQCELDP